MKSVRKVMRIISFNLLIEKNLQININTFKVWLKKIIPITFWTDFVYLALYNTYAMVTFYVLHLKI